jgi:acetaldehyde dehydrogenase (acetylating)
MREGKGAFAEPAIVEIDLRSLALGAQVLPISGYFRHDGRDNNMVMTGAVAPVGMLSGFVSGHSASSTQGRELRAFTRATVPVLLPPDRN